MKSLLPFLLFGLLTLAARADEAPSLLIIGADISWIQQQEAEGIRWSDEGVEKDIFT